MTGGARGLGAAIAAQLAADGADVTVFDVLAVPDGAVAGRIVDVTEPDQVDAAAAEVAERCGGIDILVNNAGVLSGRAPYTELAKDELMRFLTVNVGGYVITTQACHPWLVRSDRGRIINVASRTFFTGAPGQLGYVASKGAVLGMTRVLAKELGPHGVTVNAVMPGQVDTPGTREHSDDAVFNATMRQQAIQRRVQPDDLAGLVAFLASDRAAMITGQTIVVDGGGYLH
ncbi:pyridoxal 4-dehydrogenase [Planosporangium mesophilum]|uniref:Pyridoxal 4-dehydrogenase n=1 Tax=Planosporangium mesophilum TaxID=689768 RepID=A0A8J3TEY5_9ACTN|nr:pyridoxal 4-dehydrogenase [Planosporangium mesophilum]